MSFEGQRRSPQTEKPIPPRVPQEMQRHIQVTGENLHLRQVVPLTPDVWKSEEGINNFITELTAAVMIFYARANEVLEQEIPGINDHSLSHIEGVKKICENLIAVSNEIGMPELKLRDLLVLYATVILHDVAQGVWGRKHHAYFGSLIAQSVITNQKNDRQVEDVISKVALYVKQHVTRDYNFDLVKTGVEFPYAIVVLGDECHIQKDRITTDGKEHFADGDPDEWYIFNRMVRESSWSWDSKNNLPCWTLTMDDLDGIQSELKTHHAADGTVGIDLDGAVMDPQQLCYNLLIKLVLNQKTSLFRSACRAIFKTPDFAVKVVGPNTNIEYYSTTKKKPLLRRD